MSCFHLGSHASTCTGVVHAFPSTSVARPTIDSSRRSRASFALDHTSVSCWEWMEQVAIPPAARRVRAILGEVVATVGPPKTASGADPTPPSRDRGDEGRVDLTEHPTWGRKEWDREGRSTRGGKGKSGRSLGVGWTEGWREKQAEWCMCLDPTERRGGGREGYATGWMEEGETQS